MKKLILLTGIMAGLVQGAEVWLPNIQPVFKHGDRVDATIWQRYTARSYAILPDHVIKVVTTDGKLLISDRFVVVDKAPKPEPDKKEIPGSAAIFGKPAEK